jgi:hypothetical protein
LDPVDSNTVTVSSLVGYDGQFNGIGYNSIDNRIYALEGADLTRSLVAVGPDDALVVAQLFGVTLAGSANIGAVDGDGFLHVTRGDDQTVNVIDVVPGSITFGMVVNVYERSEANAGDGTSLGPDIAYNPADGLFYSIRDNNELVSMDPRTGAVELLDTIPPSEVAVDPVGIGALFMLGADQFAFIGLDAGQVAVVDLSSPDYVGTELGTFNPGAELTNVDAASCPGIPPVARFSFDPQFAFTSEPSTVELSIQNNNDSPLNLIEGEFVALIPEGVTSETSSLQSCTEIPASIEDGGSTLVMQGGDSLPANFECEITFNVSASETGSYTFELPAGEIESSQGANQNEAIGTLYVVSDETTNCQLDPEALLGYSCECEPGLIFEGGECVDVCLSLPDSPECTGADVIDGDVTDGGGDGDGGPGGDVTDGTGDGADTGNDAIDEDGFDSDDAIDEDGFDTDDVSDVEDDTDDVADVEDDAETIEDVDDAETTEDVADDTVTPDASTDVEDDVSAPDVEDDATPMPDTDDDPGDVLTDDRVRFSGGSRNCATTSGGAGSMGLSFMVLIGLFWRGRRNDS